MRLADVAEEVSTVADSLLVVLQVHAAILF